MNQSKVSEQRLRGEAMRQQCMTLRRAGGSYREIGKAVGISWKNARKHVRNAFAELRRSNLELAEDVRNLELQRLDQMQAAIWQAALEPEPVVKAMGPNGPIIELDRDRQLRAIDRVLKIQERRAELLGLDAAEKFEQSGPGGGPIPLKQEEGPFDLSKLSLEQLRQYREILRAGGAQEASRPKPA